MSDLYFRTGKAPKNAEPSPEAIWNHPITPLKQFYIRSHNVPPELDWDTHLIDLCFQGNVIHRLSMDELKNEFPAAIFPVTMVCDGNRRKELNVIKRTNGFDWGCCALSTGLFKGVLLKDVLCKYYSADHLKKSNWVQFESADKLTRGYYGTSLASSVVMDETSDFMLAYGMNGAKLTADHGFPVRTVLPGYVGGRTVKWLQKIDLTVQDSDNHYHLQDNCVFPSTVTSTALMSKTVVEYNQRYTSADDKSFNRHPFIIHEQNLNSVILFPKHGAVLNLEDSYQPVDIQGYAYDGGGRKVIRVELSLDNGETWHQCDVWYPSDYQPRHGHKYYVMCRWSVKVATWKLSSAKWLKVRAWNRSVNTQPEHPNWNILGMMNNAWYCVQIERLGANTIRFSHPVRLQTNEHLGWMEVQNTISRYDEKQVPPVSYSRQEVKRHNKVSDCWVIIDNKVYDLTDFVNLHPGGTASIISHAGEDVTVPFYDIHSDDTHVFKAAYLIGTVTEDDVSLSATGGTRHPFLGKRHPRITPDGKEIAISPFKWIDVTLKDKVVINHDTRRFIFALPSADQRMWLPWGKHVNLGVELSDRMVVRPYTPIKPILASEDDGTFQLVIKIYFPTETRPGGEMTQILESLNVGDTVKVKGPEGVLWYLGNGQFTMHGHFFFCDRMNFIVGGTGITPALAVIRAVILAEKDKSSIKPQIRLVFANKTVSDILCREEIDELLKASSDFSVRHVIDHGDVPSDDGRISYATGHVSVGCVGDFLLSASNDVSCFICGPPAMIALSVLPMLDELGFDDDQIYEF